MTISHLEKEILQQPTVIRNFLTRQSTNIATISDQVRSKYKFVVIAARGTSDNAARYAQYLFGAHNRLQVALATPSLFTFYNTHPDLSDALVIGISQSGRSPDIISVIEAGRKCGSITLAITNDPASPLALSSDFIIPLGTGVEKAVAATKTYSTSLAAMAMFSSMLSGEKSYLKQIELLPQVMEETIEFAGRDLERVQRYRYINRCSVLGRGFNYATAFEIALKIKELTGVIAESYSSADFRHGPIATVSRGSPVIVVAPSGKLKQDISSLIHKLSTSGAELIVISDSSELLGYAKVRFQTPKGIPEWLTPIPYVIPGQLFALQLTREMGLPLDQPAGLTKITETY
jgi:glucosamine--fructose-6-phosphate aminotransferase (isomerizing)